jgi:hypothetical protein
MTNYCGNCASYVVGECHRNAPLASHGDQNNWPRVDSTDWCLDWTTGTGYSGTSTLTWGTATPSGGNNGDFYILRQDPSRIAYRNINGTWTQIGTL